MINYKENIIDMLLKEIPDLQNVNLEQLIEVPPNPELGDYAFPVFSLAKVMRKSPNIIAKDLSEKISSEYFEKIEANGPYLNFFVNQKCFAKMILDEIKDKKDDFGKSDMGNGKNVVLDFSSPNIAKTFHIGHLRSTAIGNAIRNIYNFLGYKTIGVNHLGDYGTQFGMLITAYKLWGDEDKIRQNPIPELLKLYVRINREAEDDESLKETSREWFRKLEEGDTEAKKLWSFFREASLVEFDRVYQLLKIKFDSFNGESFYSDKMDAIVNELYEKGLLKESNNTNIVDLEEFDMPPLLVNKSDGSTLYATRDLAAANYRHNTYNFYKAIYIVGSQQILHFKQVFKVLELMGREWAKDCIHVPFGMVSLPEGTMSTRKGNVVSLENVLLTAKAKISEIIENRDIEDKDTLARQIGIGAVVFQELFNDRNKDYVFDWERALSFEGETGPYVQYTHARICSLLDKGSFTTESPFDENLLNSPEELEILKLIYGFNGVVVDAAEKYQPFYITRHVTELAKAFNKYYNSTEINVSDDNLKSTRLWLCYATKIVLKNGLGIIGIESPERM